MAKNDNPWSLTPAESRAVEAVLTTGCHKLAARSLGLSTKTIDVHMSASKAKVGSRTRLEFLLTYDRWNRGRP